MLPKTARHIRRLPTVKAATTLTLQDVDTGSHNTKEKVWLDPAIINKPSRLTGKE